MMLNHWDLKMIHTSHAWIGRKITYMETQLTSFHLAQLMTSDILEDKISGSPFSESFPDSQSVDVSFFLDPMRTLHIPSSYFNYNSAHFHIEDIPTLWLAQISSLMQTSGLSTKHMGQNPNRLFKHVSNTEAHSLTEFSNFLPVSWLEWLGVDAAQISNLIAGGICTMIPRLA